jgi:hypothetical protein
MTGVVIQLASLLQNHEGMWTVSMRVLVSLLMLHSLGCASETGPWAPEEPGKADSFQDAGPDAGMMDAEAAEGGEEDHYQTDDAEGDGETTELGCTDRGGTCSYVHDGCLVHETEVFELCGPNFTCCIP